MITEEALQKLHVKASLGEPLSSEESMALEAWYAKHDAEELAAWAAAGPPTEIPALQAQLGATLSRIATLAQRIQRLVDENEKVRQEVIGLQQQVAQKRMAQPA